VSTYNFVDNMATAIEYAGRILIDLIPKVYDTPRVVRILGEDDSDEKVLVNAGFINPETGEQKKFDLNVGVYDVTVRAGPTYETKRQEQAAAMMDLLAKDPALMNLIGDLVIGSMDWPGADKIAERMKTMLPPAIQQAETGKSPIPPMVAQQMQVMSQQLQECQQQLQMAQGELAKQTQATERAGIDRDRALLQKEREGIALEREQVKLMQDLAKAQQAAARTWMRPEAVPASGGDGARAAAGREVRRLARLEWPDPHGARAAHANAWRCRSRKPRSGIRTDAFRTPSRSAYLTGPSNERLHHQGPYRFLAAPSRG
jgi:hypothetical protein